jgi:hypothetical protein
MKRKHRKFGRLKRKFQKCGDFGGNRLSIGNTKMEGQQRKRRRGEDEEAEQEGGEEEMEEEEFRAPSPIRGRGTRSSFSIHNDEEVSDPGNPRSADAFAHVGSKLSRALRPLAPSAPIETPHLVRQLHPFIHHM